MSPHAREASAWIRASTQALSYCVPSTIEALVAVLMNANSEIRNIPSVNVERSL